ncbi:PIG-L family deacetylase [Paracidobacterium acidisoli]|nr:PIG-L family deacetylase [Paracidobacterium acidisoli]MBT9330591.1 PIG-L family deacetylase [Paracidobacterium acidisoli]
MSLAAAGILVPALFSFFAQPSLAEAPCEAAVDARQDAVAIPEDRGAAALWQVLQKLHTRASMMMITAHPDDEDGGVLAYESRTEGARVALMTLNRGEGGANVMSSDLWDPLGLVRTEELLQADRYYCVQQFFSVAADYGFSKTLDEALQKWGHDRIFYDVVRAVRITRPLVITSVFVGGPSDGHGNHAAAGRFAQEVFRAAGDPNVFPDQIKEGLQPWNPLKEYARVPFSLEQGNVSPKGLYDYATHHWAPAGVQNYITGRFEPGAVSATVNVPEGTYNSLIGLDDRQIARTGLGFQKSQNGGPEVPLDGPEESAYHRFASRIPAGDKEKSFFDGIDISLSGIADLAAGENHTFLTQGLERLNGIVEGAITNYSASEPGRIAGALADGLKATTGLIAEVSGSSLSERAKYDVVHELKVKQAQFNDALVLSLGITVAANIAPAHEPSGPFARFMGIQPSFQMAIPGQDFRVKVHVAETGATPVRIDEVAVHAVGKSAWSIQPGGSTSAQLHGGDTFDASFGVHVPDDAAYTRPYFERPDMEQPYYDLRDAQYRGMPLAPYPLEAWVTASYQGVQIRLAETVQTVQRQVGPGLVFQPMPIGPAISVSLLQSAGVVPPEKTSFPVSVRIHSNVKGSAQGSLHLEMPPAWRSEPATYNFSLAQDGEEQVVTFQVFPEHIADQAYQLTAVAEYQNHQYKEGYTETGYQGLRPYFYYQASTYRAVGADVKIAPGLSVGYIEGSGDDVPQSLEDLDVHVHFLTQQDLAGSDLSKYNVILVGVRAYAVRDDLRTYNGRLLDYVKNGGVVIVQYQTPEFDHNFGPYPYTMTSDPEEVTDENSPVAILDPSSPVLSWPNRITEKDFQGWIEERGSKFMQSWDSHYQPLIETHDPGQDPQKGGFLVAHYGRGMYVYTAYAFYRELPLGVPGAFRIFANLVSLPDNPERKQ